MADRKQIADPLIGDLLVAVTLHIPASKEAVLRRCADLLASGSPQGRAIENIIQVVATATARQPNSADEQPDGFGSAA